VSGVTACRRLRRFPPQRYAGAMLAKKVAGRVWLRMSLCRVGSMVTADGHCSMQEGSGPARRIWSLRDAIGSRSRAQSEREVYAAGMKGLNERKAGLPQTSEVIVTGTKLKRFAPLLFAVLCVGALPMAAQAEVYVGFNLTGMELAYDAPTGRMTINDTQNTWAAFGVRNDKAYLDVAYVLESAGDEFEAVLDLDVTRAGVGSYLVRGTFRTTDANVAGPDGIRGTSDDYALVAEFVGTGVAIDPQGFLRIDGRLEATAENGSVFANRDGPGAAEWVFSGVPRYSPLAPDADGNRGTVTLTEGDFSAEDYDVGRFVEIYFRVGAVSLDDFFAADRYVATGNVRGLIGAPVPGAAFLALLGLAMCATRLKWDRAAE